mmetsp:Transcript_76725/g.214439  ORF Transcript_76725/g.214439 Transcript_76725/m.214439 type:complete len:207 (+) Transcript_76725:229-849(+)
MAEVLDVLVWKDRQRELGRIQRATAVLVHMLEQSDDPILWESNVHLLHQLAELVELKNPISVGVNDLEQRRDVMGCVTPLMQLHSRFRKQQGIVPRVPHVVECHSDNSHGHGQQYNTHYYQTHNDCDAHRSYGGIVSIANRGDSHKAEPYCPEWRLEELWLHNVDEGGESHRDQGHSVKEHRKGLHCDLDRSDKHIEGLKMPNDLQ